MSTGRRLEGVLFIREWPDRAGMITFWCPGCEQGHTITFGTDETWQWNGDVDKPTFTPSVLANSLGGGSEEWRLLHPRCHSFVTDGRIEYLSDSEHKLAGTTVEMVPLPERWRKFLD